MHKDETKFWQFLRSGLRKLSQRYPPVYEALAAAKRPYVGDNPRQKVCYECAMCNKTFPSKEVAVDHKVPAGKLSCKEHVADFIDKLFCGKDGLQVLCSSCHSVKTLAEKLEITLEEAVVEKQVIAFKKLKVAEQNKILASLGESATLPSAAKRIARYRELIKTGETNGN